MSLYKCTKCHHEWEGPKLKPRSLGWSHTIVSTCAWCQAPGKILEEETDLEKMDFDKLLKELV
jgi:hypothetical protein